METSTDSWEKLDAKGKANLLRGGMSFKEHYNYLMDWYMNDRKLSGTDVRESLKDVLEALKELEARTGQPVLVEKPRQQGIFTRLVG